MARGRGRRRKQVIQNDFAVVSGVKSSGDQLRQHLDVVSDVEEVEDHVADDISTLTMELPIKESETILAGNPLVNVNSIKNASMLNVDSRIDAMDETL